MRRGASALGAKVAAVGRSTALRLATRGIAVSLVPERFTGAALVEAMVAEGVQGARVLFPRGDLAHPTVPEGLTRAGAYVEEVETYRTVRVAAIAPELLAALKSQPLDVAIFLSPSSVRNLAAMLDGDLAILAGSIIACIGPVTAAAALEAGLTVHVEPVESTIPATVAAIERFFDDRLAKRALVPALEPVGEASP
jgi:uroporphyrinogen III methyltransferase/synthase